MAEISGHCQCGGVAFTAEGEFYGVVSCHCKDCQRLHGNYNPMLVVEKADFTLTKEESLAWYDTSAEKDRGFCKVCGSALFMRQKQGAKILISAGCIDDTSNLKNVKNIFTEEAGSYYALPPEVEA